MCGIITYVPVDTYEAYVFRNKYTSIDFTSMIIGLQYVIYFNIPKFIHDW